MGFGVKGRGIRALALVGKGVEDAVEVAHLVSGPGVRVQGSGFRVQGSGFRVQGSGFRV